MFRYSNFREWIDLLDKEGELLRVGAAVEVKWEAGAVVRRLLDRGPNKAVLFERPCNNGEPFSIPILANSTGTPRRLALALDLPEDPRAMLPAFIARTERDHYVEPVLVASGTARCKEVVLRGRECDLSALPIPTLNAEDGGPYISLGINVTRHPEHGRNVTIQRLQVKGPRKTGYLPSLRTDTRANIDYAWSQGKACPVAVCIGVDPVIGLAAAMGIPRGWDEFALAGAIRGKAVSLVKCETSDLEVPADAEIVIEGEIPPGVREPEGPFGEYTGHYSGVTPQPIFEVKAITMRKGPIYHALYIGRPVCENHVLNELLRSAVNWRSVKQAVLEPKAVHVTPAGANGYNVYISIKKHHDGEPKLAMMAVWTAVFGHGYGKHVFVFDDDVDVYDYRSIDWALATRVQADRDVLIIPNMVGEALDPSAQGRTGDPLRIGVPEVAREHRAVMGIDATRPLSSNYSAVVEPPDSIAERVAARWSELIGRDEHRATE